MTFDQRLGLVLVIYVSAAIVGLALSIAVAPWRHKR